MKLLSGGSRALVAARAAAVLLNFATTAYLLHRLGPEPFGLMAMAVGAVALVRAFGQAGIDASLVSDPELSEERTGAALLMSVGLGVLLAGGALAATPLVVWFYAGASVVTPWIVLSLLVIPSLAASIPTALAQREERFGRIALAELLVAVAASLGAVALAMVRADYWPILVRQLIGSVAGLFLIWALMPPKVARPRRDDFIAVRRFSLSLLVAQLLNTASRYADDLLIGRHLGQRQLGLYALCYRVLTFPLDQVSGLVSTIAYPRIAALAPDWRRCGEEIAILVRRVSLVMTPVVAGVVVAAPELITLIAGGEWLEAVVTFRILAVIGALQVPARLVGIVFLVNRKTEQSARWAMFATPIIVLSFVAGLPWGIAGVAASYGFVSLFLVPLFLRHAAVTLGVGASVFVSAAGRGISLGAVAALPIVGVALAARYVGASGELVLAATIGVGVLVEVMLLRR